MEICKQWRIDPEVFLEVKNWFKMQNHLPQHAPDEYIAMIIHSCYSDVARSKKTVEAYFRIKTIAPQLFSGRNLQEENLQQVLRVAPFGILDGKSEEGCSIVFGWIDDPTPSNFVTEDVLKYMYMVVDVILKENPACPGIIFLHDSTHFSFRHLFRISLTTLKRYFEYIQDACPIRIKGIHVLNAGAVMTQTLNLCRPFMYKEYSNIITLYTSSNFEDMLKNTKISIDIVPKDFGGKGPSKQKLYQDTMKKVETYADWFSVDETLRIVGKT